MENKRYLDEEGLAEYHSELTDNFASMYLSPNSGSSTPDGKPWKYYQPILAKPSGFMNILNNKTIQFKDNSVYALEVMSSETANSSGSGGDFFIGVMDKDYNVVNFTKISLAESSGFAFGGSFIFTTVASEQNFETMMVCIKDYSVGESAINGSLAGLKINIVKIR